MFLQVETQEPSHVMSIPNIVILSAGAGFRMHPFTLYRPKSLCTVANVSLLKRQLLQLQAAGFGRSVIVLSRRTTGLNDWISDVVPDNFQLDVMFPREGGEEKVSLVRRAIGSDLSSVLVIYGDSFLMVDFRELVECHQRNVAKGGLATILYHRPADIRIPERDGRTYHGVLSVDRDGCITRFVEKPKVDEVSDGFDLANAAVFIIERDFLDLPAFERANDFSFDIFEPAIKQSMPVFGCDIGPGFRFDVGGIARWHELNLRVIRKEIDVPVPGNEVAPSVWLGNDTAARLECLESPVLVGDNVLLGANVKLCHHQTSGCEVSI
jgi:NDP-sugar pyrophosphorylase family protein